MEENRDQISRTHNIVIIIITVSCLGAVVESISQGWEFWVPPLILGGVIASWGFHLTQYRQAVFRENFYMILSMVVAFFHGVHQTSFFDVVVISVLLMVTATIIKRPGIIKAALIEFIIIILMQVAWAFRSGTMAFDSLLISRIALHVAVELCVYRALLEILKNEQRMEAELGRKNKEEVVDRTELENFLVNISHELRTPVNVINGMTSLILKKEDREDVQSIRDAGFRLSLQIEDIQDYSEIQRGDARLEEEKYMISSLVNNIVATYNVLVKNKRLEFVIDLDPNLPSMMRGDSKKIDKIIAHLLDNAFKFTKEGGVFLRITGYKKDYGINLIIEVTDTGIGMTQADLDKLSKGRYQVNQKRNRSVGGIGLGLSIVLGFARLMNGFVSVESQKGKGTTVRVSLVQEIIDPSPCLSVSSRKFINAVFHVIPEKYKVSELREYYSSMAANMAAGLRMNLYSAPNIYELKKLVERGTITHIFMGVEEYNRETEYFDELSKEGIVVAVSASEGFIPSSDSRVVVMPKPLYGYQVVKVINGDAYGDNLIPGKERRPELEGIRTLIVDDEPMNLVVATGLFREYKMVIETAESGFEAIEKFRKESYDVIFMDHMMPEMDGIEAMEKLRFISEQNGSPVCIIALTANAISGAKEMFMKKGFDGFISKPINMVEFERVMNRVITEGKLKKRGGAT